MLVLQEWPHKLHLSDWPFGLTHSLEGGCIFRTVCYLRDMRRKLPIVAVACLVLLSLHSSLVKRTLLLHAATQQGAPSGQTMQFDKPLYYTRQVAPSDLVFRSLVELTLMRNTIYARAGNSFRKKWLADYFTSQPWYHPLPEMDASKLTSLDRKNAEIIATYDASLTRDQLERMLRVVMSSAANDQQPRLQDNIEIRLLSARLGKWVGSKDTPQEDRSPLEDPSILDKQLTLQQLNDLSRRDLRLLRNIIYARRGRPFRSPLLNTYFSATDWYKVDPSYTEARLTQVDSRNIKLIRSLEDQLGGPLTDSEHQREDGFIIAQ
jgi:hypothetical protein